MDGMSFCVSAEKFFKLVNAMPRELSLRLTEAGTLFISGGRNESKLNTLPAAGFPFIADPAQVQWTYAPNFVSGLSRVEFTMSQNATKTSLMGVGVKDDYMYSSDGMRVSRYKLSMAVPNPLTIPSDAVKNIIRLGQPEQFMRTDSKIVAWYPSTRTTFVSQLVAQDFPYDSAKKAFELVSGNVDVSFPQELSEALARVALLAPEENSDVVMENMGNGIKIHAQSEIGSGDEFIEWNYQNEFKFSVNPLWFKAAFEASSKVDLTNVTTGDKRMLLFKHEDGFEHLLALMTLRG
jgi:DNA polymerase III sliding clamp (beta) subunit (PCNA family)